MRADIQKLANEGVSFLHLALVQFDRAKDRQEAVVAADASPREGEALHQLAAVCDMLHALYVRARFVD